MEFGHVKLFAHSLVLKKALVHVAMETEDGEKCDVQRLRSEAPHHPVHPAVKVQLLASPLKLLAVLCVFGVCRWSGHLRGKSWNKTIGLDTSF